MRLIFDSFGKAIETSRKTVSRCLLAGFLAAATLCAPVAANAADRIVVVLDQAKVLQLPPNTATIIVGNPLVADVTMINRNTQLILTGKSFGETNMIALDKRGNSVGESTVIVRSPETSLVVQRGMVQESYSCQPRCEPTVRLGDDPNYSTAQITAANGRAAAAASAPAPAPAK